jgi:hypothetical protein
MNGYSVFMLVFVVVFVLVLAALCSVLVLRMMGNLSLPESPPFPRRRTRHRHSTAQPREPDPRELEELAGRR